MKSGIRFYVTFIVLLVIINTPQLLAQQRQLVLDRRFPDTDSKIEGDHLVHPFDVVKANDTFYVSDYDDNSLKMFSADGRFIKKISSEGYGPGKVLKPYLLAIDPDSGKVLCADQRNQQISSFTLDGNYLNSVWSTSPLMYAMISYNGNIYVSAHSKSTEYLYQILDQDGELVKNFGFPFDKNLNKLKYGDALYRQVTMQFYRDKLYVFYFHLPKITIYNSNGDFINKIDVHIDFVKDMYKHNINPQKVVKGNARLIKDWIRGACVDNNLFYCFALREGQMLVLNTSGELIETIPFADVDRENLDVCSGWWFRLKTGNEFIFTDFVKGHLLVYKLENK